MKRWKDSEVEAAKKLRESKKYSFAELQRITGIPATTIRNWCQDDYKGTRWDTLLASNERKRQGFKLSEKKTIDSIKNIDGENAKIYASLIYWCEGAKYPSTSRLEFTNSDPKLLSVFINLVRKAFSVDEKKFRAHVQIHTTHKYIDIKRFWSKCLKIAPAQFIKPTITKPKGKKHRKGYLGTCTLRYYDYRLQLKLIGIYEEFANRFNNMKE